MTEIRTDDLFLGAYALACGAEVIGVETTGWNGKRVVVVRLRGEGLAQRERDYLCGQAVANVTAIKGQLKHIKDVVFAELRAAEERDQRGEIHAHQHRRQRRRA